MESLEGMDITKEDEERICERYAGMLEAEESLTEKTLKYTANIF